MIIYSACASAIHAHMPRVRPMLAHSRTSSFLHTHIQDTLRIGYRESAQLATEGLTPRSARLPRTHYRGTLWLLRHSLSRVCAATSLNRDGPDGMVVRWLATEGIATTSPRSGKGLPSCSAPMVEGSDPTSISFRVGLLSWSISTFLSYSVQLEIKQ